MPHFEGPMDDTKAPVEQGSRSFWLAWAFSVVPLLGFWLYGLFDLDEGFYAAVVGEMNRRGEWITPYFQGQPWFEKPILLYWLAKPSVMLFGEDFGPRLPSILAMAAVYWLVGWWVRRHFSLRAAMLSMIAVGSSLLVVAVGRMMLADALLLLCLVGAFLSFHESLVGDPRWRLATAMFLGFSVLAKGPVGCAFFMLLAAWTYWHEPQWRRAFRGWWLAGTGILVAIVASWYIPAWLENRDLFVQKFLIEQNLGRFGGGDRAHAIGGALNWVFYVPVLLVGMLPWSLFIPTAWPKQTDSSGLAHKRYLAAWAVIVFVFFTISGSKLVHYILPAIPPLAILVALWLDTRLAPGAWKGLRWPLVWLGAVATMAIVGTPLYYNLWDKEHHSELREIARWLNGHPGAVVVYQMGRRNADLGTGRAELQETSHPSLSFYLHEPFAFAETPAELASIRPHFVLTRTDRLSLDDLSRLKDEGLSLSSVNAFSGFKGYAVFEAATP